MYSAMKILVTGAAGFFGSNLTEYLLEKGHKVVGIDNFNEYYSPDVKEYNIREFKDNKSFKLYRTDITDLISLSGVFKKEAPFDAVVHLAAWAGVTFSIKHPMLYVYGDNQIPFDEDMSIDSPRAPYPVTKRACELLLRTYSDNFKLPVTILRIFNPQGKRMRPDLALSKLIRSCEYGTEFPIYQDLKKSGRDYCYIVHMFEAIDSIISEPYEYEIFNLGNSSPVTLGDFIGAVEKVTGKKVKSKVMPQRMGEMTTTYANITKAKKTLGFNPSTPIEESIKIFYEWYLAQDENYKKGNL
jgi:UDP-glucuronate 4-epimerase